MEGPTLDGAPEDDAPEAPAAMDGGEVRRGGLGARIVAAGVGLALLGGGLAFAATQAGSGGGSGSPEEAVSRLFDALSDEDVLGVLAALDEGERDTLREPTEALFEELERLEVLDDFELTGVPGIDLDFDGLTFRTEPIAQGLTRVHLTGGTASFAVDGTELPVGDFLADALDRFGVDHTELDEREEDEVSADDDVFLVARETADGWRVSLGYTAVEAIRMDLGRPVPATGMAPVGADSPEAAVEGLLRAAAAVDVRGIVARLSPHELGALQHYWPVLVDDADLPTADDVGATIELTDLELEADTDGDRAVVAIRAIGADVTTDDFEGGATLADGCITLRGDAYESVRDEVDIDDETICQDELDEILGEAMAGATFGMEGLDELLAPGSDGGVEGLGITTTRVDGRWYVAPVRTVADLGLAMLRTVDREDLEAVVDAIDGFFGEGFFGGGSVGGGFVPPGMTGDFDDLGTLEELEGFEGIDDLGSFEEELEDLQGIGEEGSEEILVEPSSGQG